MLDLLFSSFQFFSLFIGKQNKTNTANANCYGSKDIVGLPWFKTTASGLLHNPNDLVFKNACIHESPAAPEGQVEYSKHSYEKLKPNYLSF